MKDIISDFPKKKICWSLFRQPASFNKNLKNWTFHRHCDCNDHDSNNNKKEFTKCFQRLKELYNFIKVKHAMHQYPDTVQ